MRLTCGIILVLCISSLVIAEDGSGTTETSPKSVETTKVTSSPTEPATTKVTSPVTKPTEPATTKVTSPVTKPTEPATTPPPTTSSAETTEPPTTPAVPATTALPPKADVGKWNVTEGNNTVCIMAQMALRILEYGKPIHNLLPSATADKSSCNNETQILVLEDGHYELSLTFKKGKSGEVFVHQIDVTYPQGTEILHAEVTNATYFSAPKEKSFKCNSNQDIPMQNLTLSFSQVQLEAFGVPDGKFKDAMICGDDGQVNSIVPIAVACILAAMVIIILISYLVFRRQSRQRGYESV